MKYFELLIVFIWSEKKSASFSMPILNQRENNLNSFNNFFYYYYYGKVLKKVHLTNNVPNKL